MSISRFKAVVLTALVMPAALTVGCNQQPSLTPSGAYPIYLLTVNTVNPATGVAITISYPDLAGATNGTSGFTRSYASGTTVILTAPASAGVNLFSAWTGCTSVSTVTCTVNVNAAKTVTATYVNPPNYTLTVGSTNPVSGVAISVAPADNNAATNGTTSFTRSYVTGTAVTLTAPAISGGNTFGSWTGCTSAVGAVCNVGLTSSRTVTANYVLPILSLRVNSTNPSAGVAISASPADNSGNTIVSTGSSLSYVSGSQITLIAPAAPAGQIFQSWTGCTSVTNALACTVILTSAQTVIANYYATNAGKTYYVGPGGNDSNTGLTLSSPLLTLQKAANLTNPGDVVYALTGSYTGATPTSTVLSISTPGTAVAPIAFRAYPGNTPTLNFASFTGIGFGINAAYIEINGLTVNGNNQNVTFAQASTPDALANPGNYPGFNGNCIIADGRSSTTNHPNHLSILNSVISNCGAGITMLGADYVTVSGNTVFNCNWYDAYGTSAISFLGFFNTDGAAGYKNTISGNKIYNNYELIPYHVSGTISDGEGIIIDTFQNSAVSGSGLNYAAYTGRTLIANNLIYDNGGAAVEIFNSYHVDIVNNSSFQNVHAPAQSGSSFAPVTGRGELNVQKAADINAYNNILYSYTGQNPLVLTTCTSCSLDYSMFFNGTNNSTLPTGMNDVYADPQYVNAFSQDLTKVDLSLINGSPAIDTGTSMIAPATDFAGTLRPQGKGYDRGAFER